MSNSKAVREQLLKQAGYEKQQNGKWRPPLVHTGQAIGWYKCDGKDCPICDPNPICFTCKSCWRRSLQSDLNNLQCPFCGGNMVQR